MIAPQDLSRPSVVVEDYKEPTNLESHGFEVFLSTNEQEQKPNAASDPSTGLRCSKPDKLTMLPTTTFGLLALGMGTAASAGMVKRGWENSYTATATKSVAKAAATAKTSSPTSHVKGKAFDRIAIFYFENTNFDKAYGDREWKQCDF